MRKISYVSVLFFMSVYLIGCGIKTPPNSDAFYRVTSPNQRVNDQVKYFGDEYLQITERRNPKSQNPKTKVKPENLVGLGLSGGGIRSAAYQLGLLAGLEATKRNGVENEQATALGKVDYLSCVSGGCWSAGAFLIANEPTDIFFECLSEQAKTGKVADLEQCSRANNILRNKQNIELIEDEKKEEWEEDIQIAYFPDECRNFLFSDRESSCWSFLQGKPNVIFNVTHSTISPTRYGAHIDNLPFQITPDQLGTIVDCGSEDLGDLAGQGEQGCGFIKGFNNGNKVGFFVQQNAENFEWARREFRYVTPWKPSTSPGSQMSKAMAHSSAVAGSPVLLSFSMGLMYKDESEFKFVGDEIRDNYFLTDGGFTENLGLLALVERGTDLIVLSDIGYPERQGDDLQMAADQVKKLLKCEVTGTKDLNSENIVSTLSYSCPKNSQNTEIKTGKILYVRPLPNNITEFKEQLELSNKSLYDCINEKTKHCYGRPAVLDRLFDENSILEEKYYFPQTATFLKSYDERLIRSYYLLGKFIGENYVGPAILK